MRFNMYMYRCDIVIELNSCYIEYQYACAEFIRSFWNNSYCWDKKSVTGLLYRHKPHEIICRAEYEHDDAKGTLPIIEMWRPPSAF